MQIVLQISHTHLFVYYAAMRIGKYYYTIIRKYFCQWGQKRVIRDANPTAFSQNVTRQFRNVWHAE